MNTVAAGAQANSGDLNQIVNFLTGATASDATVSAIPVGALTMYAGTAAPTGWLVCDGRAVSRTTYANLFAVVASTYGAGDGSTTFNLPDLRSRFAVGANAMLGGSAGGGTARGAASTGGEENHTLTNAEMPSHSHSGATGGRSAVHNHTGISNFIRNSVSAYGLTTTGVAQQAAADNSAPTATETQEHTHGVAVDGSSAAHNNIPPYIALGFIIKA